MMTAQDRQHFAEYEHLDDATRRTVDACFYQVKEQILADGLIVAYDDRAEALTAAIARYVLESKKDNQMQLIV